jgi:hypothetical protein
MPPPGRTTLGVVLVLVLSLLAVQTAGASGGGTLAGEDFLAQLDDLTVTFDCHPDAVSTVSYTATGVATGPYPGTFTVSGTVAIGPHTDPGQVPGTLAGPILSVSESFSITSVNGTVEGTKTHQKGQPIEQSQGTCQQVTGFAVDDVTNASGTVVEVATQPFYTATIHDVLLGDVEVGGEAQLSFGEVNVTGDCLLLGTCTVHTGGFSQNFMTSNPICDDDDDGDNGGDCDDDDQGRD